jgi:hypothetical protein
LEGMAGMAGVGLVARRGAQEFADVRFVWQGDPVWPGLRAGARGSPDFSWLSGVGRQIRENLK